MATVNISNPLRVANANATGPQDAYLPSANAGYGPYSSLSEAQQELNTIFNNNIPLGITVGVKLGNTITEYWNPSSPNTFVAKMSTTGTGGSSTNIYTVLSIPDDTTTVLNSLYPSATKGTIVINSSTGGTYLCYDAGSWIKFNGTILTDTAPVAATITEANILSYK
jgi:hypothetical protein